MIDKDFIKNQLENVVQFNKKLQQSFDSDKNINRSNFG